MDLWGLVLVAWMGVATLIILGIPTLLISSKLERERQERFMRPRIEAERENIERQRMGEFLDH